MCPIQINILKTILLKCYILKKNELERAADKAYSHSQSIFGIKYYLKQILKKNPKNQTKKKNQKNKNYRAIAMVNYYFYILI